MSMLTILKPIGLEIQIQQTPNSVGDSKLVRIVNSQTTPVAIQIVDEMDVVYSQFTMLPSSQQLVQKNPKYKIKAVTSSVLAVAAQF